MGTIRGQHIPEGPAIDAAFTNSYLSCLGIQEQCAKIATQLTAYAAKIDKVHAAILDLLARICDPLTGLKEVWELLTDQDEDEIKKIANDIRTIVNNFTAEVDALRQQIATVLSEATTIITTMGGYAAKRFYEGVGQEAVGILEGTFWTYSLPRAIIDPSGWYHSVIEQIDGMAPLVGLGGDGAPGFGEAWKDLGKEVTHWDEWSSNPFKAGGETVVDLITLGLPGGPVSKLPKLGRAAADAAKGLKGLRTPKPPPLHAEPPKPNPPVRGEPAPPRHEPPNGGRPAPAPQSKPTPPPHGPVPRGPTDSKPPVTEKPPPGAAPRLQVEPSTPRPGHEPAGGVPKLPAAAPSAPGHAPLNGEHSPGVAPSTPAPTSPGASISNPPPVAAHTPQAAPAAPAPSAPHFPPEGRPPEPPPVERPPAPSPGGHPLGPYPHDGAPGAHPPEAPPRDVPPSGPDGAGDPHESQPSVDDLPQGGAEPGRPEFNLDNPLDHMSPELRALSEQHLTGSGETVLGPFQPDGGAPSYIDVARQRGASYFDIGDAWNGATPIERLAANQHLLDIAIANRDTIRLSVPFGKISPDSFTAAEIRYLEAHGYHRVGNTILSPPTGGAPR